MIKIIFNEIRATATICAFVFIYSLLLEAATAGTLVKWRCDNSNNAEECHKSQEIEYIYIYDEINSETEEVFESINGDYPLNKPFPPVYINSHGGDVQSAFHIGRILRERAATIEARDMIHTQNQVVCDSACVLVAAGATKRNLLQMGLHRGFYKKRIKGERYETIPLEDKDLNGIQNYLTEMSINPEVFNIIRKTEHTDMTEFYFSLEEKFENQKIVKLGFRMRKPDSEETIRLNHLIGALDYGRDAKEKLAIDGDNQAAFDLSKDYLYGDNGSPENIALGIKWLKVAANSGLPIAQHNLAVIYANGEFGQPKNNNKAIFYYQLAAESGLASSQNNLGWMYYKGSGVAKNNSEAIHWITRAAEQGEPFAYGSLGEIYYDGKVFEKNDIQTFKWLKLAVNSLPNGRSLADDKQKLEIISKRMTKENIQIAEKLASQWKPLKQEKYLMRDKDDQ
jgi:Sel1 repeat